MLDFGRSLGLEAIKDRVGNVIIRKPATEGMEDRQPVILQAHLDMVHQKNSGTEFDFDTQGIDMYVDGDWVTARGTTLGADNGMGVAAIMAILAEDSIPHPELEALFTVDEETGMSGAKGLEGGILKGQILLNLDTEEDDEIDIGCAGGIDVTAAGSYKEQLLEGSASGYEISVRGLQGGHSGMDIDKGLGNANKIMNSLLQSGADAHDLRIARLEGGGLRNAIPRESKARVVIPYKEIAGFENNFAGWGARIKGRLADTDPELSIQLVSIDLPVSVMDSDDQKKLLQAISAAHNGVYSMNKLFDGLVESSNNIASVSVMNGDITIGCLVRSSVDPVKSELVNSLELVFKQAGYKVSCSGDYPGWNPDPDSRILKIIRSRYENLFNSPPRVIACHAGLECGILSATYPNMDMVSFGPTIRGAHSPDERVQIRSVQKFWVLLTDLLGHIPTGKDSF